MRRLAKITVVLAAAVICAPHAAFAQAFVGGSGGTVPGSVRAGLTPLGWYAIGSIGCAAAAPIVGTILLNRALTASEVGRSTLSCVLGPVGWVLGPVLFPSEVVVANGPPRNPPPRNPSARGRNVGIPPAGETRFVRDEVLIEVDAGTSARYLAIIARRLQLARLETQSFTLTGRTLQRWRIAGARPVGATLRALAGYVRVAAAQPNYLYGLQQTAAATAADTAANQYVVGKLHLLQAHRISNGDDVLVAVIDSKIDAGHPDLVGDIAAEYDPVGGQAPAHLHGTGMAGAIAAHGKLVGVAPKVKLLAVRAFSGSGESAQGTTFNILKGLDWAAQQRARIVNMSFAGPADPLLRDMLDKAYARGMVLIAAVGNAGPRSPPLYPAADPHVIGVTATDANDTLLPQANRGRQVTFAAPGVDILVPAPQASYQLTSGTSVAAAHASGVAALLLAEKPGLSPDAVKHLLVGSAHALPGKPQDVGAGLIDALAAVEAAKN